MKGKLKSDVELAMERLKTKGSDSEIRELPEEAKQVLMAKDRVDHRAREG